MGLFEGKKGLILGVFNNRSIAWAIAELIMKEGGVCGFSYMPDKADDPRQKNRQRVQRLLDEFEGSKLIGSMDVTKDEDISAFMKAAKEEFGQIDFLVHSIAFAPPEDLKKDTIETSRAGFKLAMDISAFSFMAVTQAARDMLTPESSVLAMTYFGGEKVVPGYNVMAVCKAALDCIVKYLAYELGPEGIRVNAVSAGPVKTVSGVGAGVDDMLQLYDAMAPLQRNITVEEVGKSAAFLLSDMSAGITGEILHVDAGYNIMGSPGRILDRIREQQQQLG